jgi:hypothetical protein
MERRRAWLLPLGRMPLPEQELKHSSAEREQEQPQRPCLPRPLHLDYRQ